MSISRIASRYAKSLMDLAIEKNAVEQTFQDIKGFEKALESRDFYNLLKSPVIPGARKISIFKTLFESKVSELTFNFFLLIIKKSREVLFAEIVNEFIVQYRKHKDIVVVRIITAIALSDESKKAVEESLKEKGIVKSNIEFHTKVDPKIIGGFQIEFEDKLIDASIKHKLDMMRRELSINLYESIFRSN